MAFSSVSLDALIIDDEPAFQAMPLYRALKRALAAANHRFLIPVEGGEVSWDRAVFLNLTFWSAEAGADVLCNDHIPADVVAHAAWHHVVSHQLQLATGGGAPTPEALFFAEAIASAFDLYLVGRLLDAGPDTDFITTQVPIMRDAAADAGMSDADFVALLEGVRADPQQAFEDLRAMLFEVTCALWACRDVIEAAGVLDRYTHHRFGSLLHHYQLSNWILYARAYSAAGARRDARDAPVRRGPSRREGRARLAGRELAGGTGPGRLRRTKSRCPSGANADRKQTVCGRVVRYNARSPPHGFLDKFSRRQPRPRWVRPDECTQNHAEAP